MKVFPIYFYVVLFSMSMVACNSKSPDKVDVSSSINAVHVPVTLIDNEPYIANKETNEGVKKLMEIVEDGLESESPNMEQIGTDLENTIKQIYASCTMSGRAFEELDSYLREANKQVQDVKNTPNKIVLIGLQTYLSQYPKYFK